MLTKPDLHKAEAFSFLETLLNNFSKFYDRTAFFIQGENYSYRDLKERIIKVQAQIEMEIPASEKYLGLAVHDDIETYATILALWFLGKAFVPLNSKNPLDRNTNIIQQLELNFILDSDKNSVENELPLQKIVSSDYRGGIEQEIIFRRASKNDDIYILFTSGSTGIPKGVQIGIKNLDSFVDNFINAGYDFNEDDRFLQIYDLSFDASVHCYTVPLALGASVYTVPQGVIKYLYAYELMMNHHLSFVKMPPSTLLYLKPFFNKINLPHLKYCLLGGEAFPDSLAKDWKRCVPNAQIQNVYGPTETTINTHIYNWDPEISGKKQYKGIVSIGKTFGSNKALIIDEKGKVVGNNIKGELCLGGKQVSRGYWKGEEKTNEAFINILVENEWKRFYKTGDIVFRDADGDYMFCGRKDSQLQIQGFRVELSEVEKHARDFLGGVNIASLGFENEKGTTAIALFVENNDKTMELKEYLFTKLPAYMIPEKIIHLEEFPKSSGGKINKKELLKYI